ncbi:tyrosine-type recombinase/integrase [Bacteroides thetaiotaomicron]|uniref:tyrosine-type recombinase/integrase n=1 Tax=Bacteroides thetaiotaomicron TaxID=818 RepID=UPI00216428E7|nr:tyrosine-type recombinase/integrase [Bacteroides thetaiotaomicron]UVS54633.1 tyrosine-type recombinase/integrase [Bacteroides thetaiotaomicron]
MYERKQNGEVFFSSLCVTYSRFGNYPANGLVTEQPQYSVVVCIFHILQNTEIQLISNDLRLIFTCSLLLASPCIFHVARHTFATTITLQREIPLETVSKMLGHTKITTTQIYARVVDTKVMRDMAALKSMYASKTEESPNKAVNE